MKRIEKPLGSSVSFAEYEAAVEANRPQVLYVIHGESSTGVVQDLTGLGDLCRK